MDSPETYKPAFTEPPGTNLAGIPIQGLVLPSPYVSYGLPYQVSCARHVKDTFNASKVYIIASGSLARNTDRLDRLVEALGKDAVVGIRRGITPHTPWSEILSITQECQLWSRLCGDPRSGECHGRSQTRRIEPAQLARYSVESNDIPANVRAPTVPLINIPTSLSGGEYFSLAGGTDDSTHHKQGFLHSGMGSKLIILDPELCTLTPEYHWLSTGVRSIDHCVEALCCLTATPASDERAERGLKLLVPNLLRCKADPSNVKARHECQMAVNLAMWNVRAGIPMGGSHAIGHQLGPLGVPHGVTSCIMCPAVMKYNIQHGSGTPEIEARQSKVRDILWSEEEVAKTLRAAGLSPESSDLGDLLDVIIRALGLPRTLSELKIAKDLLPALSRRALDDFWAPTNPVPLLKSEQVQEILEAVA
ncbi:Dehydroquinate synthase-like protein [Pochonia chlamydosporia 170]|uniref:Dehydroquinate synthase-like protein n=1 Tax=Pochonia chlamydosporia 170 TaxID=1380566 RepID=A0A179FED4_METCM|nr:Dehydroquinate synthase-like protein [Pochonia chlamydosporia 170]OAQ63670.2 Dehydroquinate synthase-like protein [Pochonia chlamydosporia 170]